ncbi:MAG: sulfatase-like hydrolase/transferase [Acidobacteria bacterium]|nr:sulfatase-like hydrolase/transferase [Acidobacteriota bacterium]
MALSLIAGCRDEAPTAEGTSRPNVIFISIDTLRSDRLPAYGYEIGETPVLDAFSRDAVLYESAWSHCPLTLPSHATMFTGLLPSENGVRDNTGYRIRPDDVLLAEVLADEGYATGAAVSAFVLRRETGIDRGFEFYDDGVEGVGQSGSIGMIQRSGTHTASVARAWLAGQSQEAPLFFFLHLYDPHTPYDPPAPFDERFDDPYDGEIAYTDTVLGEFFDFLRERGLYESSLIIVASDHGEGLGDHGEEEHGIFLYRESIQVPLMIRYPGGRGAGTRVETPVMLSDLFPTVLDSVGLGHRIGEVTGESIEAVTGKPPRKIYSESFYPRLHYGWSDLHSLTDGTTHFIEAPRPELYDLASDPGETENVLEERRRTFFEFRDAIAPFIREAEAPEEVDPETAAQLAALGYLAGGSAASGDEDLPDPKDGIGTLARVTRAFQTFRNGDLTLALSQVEEELAENRRVLDLWDLRMRILARLGRLDEAIEAGREALRLSPTSTHRAIAVAAIALRANRLDDAVSHAKLAANAEPAPANDIFARVALARGELDEAEAFARKSIAAAPDNIDPHMTMARVEKERGNLEAAWASLEEASKLARRKQLTRVEGLHFLRGDVLARMRRPQEAEREFRQEIALFPEEPQAYKNLLLLLVSEKKLREAERLIADLIEASPTPPSYIAISETLNVIGDPRAARFWARQGLEEFPNDPRLRELARS